MTKTELINTIEMAKHDIKMRVRAVVLDPIDAMSEEGAATSDYYDEQGKQHKQILKQAEWIMEVFSKKWRNVKSTEDEQLAQLEDNISSMTSSVIPQIKTIAAYYKKCLKNKYFFSDSDSGSLARTKMTKAVAKYEKVCLDLSKIGNASDSVDQSKLNLLATLQEILDDINAYVYYKDEVSFSEIEVSTDKDIFQNRVLLNIQENANKHAFGTREWKNKHLWEKEVRVAYKSTPKFHVVTISNNGTPFKGKEEKIFDTGYCYGEQKHSGYGLNSAKVHMQKLGGDIQFASTPHDEFTVCFTLKLPKNV